MGIERYAEHARGRFLTSEEFARLGDALRLGETTGLEWEIDETKPKTNRAQTRKPAAHVGPFRGCGDPPPNPDRRPPSGNSSRAMVGGGFWARVFALGGQQDRQEARLPLGGGAFRSSSALPRIEGNPHIIAGAKDGAPRADPKKPWAAVTKAAGLEGVVFTTCAIPSPASARARPWACSSLASCSDIPKRRRRIVTRISTRTRCGARSIRIGATITAAMNGDKSDEISFQEIRREASLQPGQRP